MNASKKIKKIMITNVITHHVNDSLRLIDKTFEKHSFHHIPILNSKRVIKGIISKEDILRLISVRQMFTEKEFGSIKAKSFMSTNLLKLNPDDTIGLAADIFLSNKFHAIPVVEDGKFIGIVTTHDVIKYAYKDSL